MQKPRVSDNKWFLDAMAAAGGVMTAGGVHDFATTCMILGEIEMSMPCACRSVRGKAGYVHA